MPTFVNDGPNIPVRLVQQLEEDKVVLFCGAGISMNAGLPDYRGLVERSYRLFVERLPDKCSDEWRSLDKMLGKLEHTHKAHVRTAIAKILDKRPKILNLHRAILQLANLKRKNGIRLVTTNFDKYFEKAGRSVKIDCNFHSAPALPVPRNDNSYSWRSVVYLHGRLAPNPEDNDHLVLTSADFGRAYLTEAWAARFVTRLFAEFTVLFIGYSLNDPILRYMMDALGAEKFAARNRSPRDPSYILLPNSQKNCSDLDEWKRLGICPIYYDESGKHVKLHETLLEWAKARRDYFATTEMIIFQFAHLLPEDLRASDVENVIWAVLGRPDDEGSGMKFFSAGGKKPPIQWLYTFSDHVQENAEKQRKATAKARDNGYDIPVQQPNFLDQLFPAISGTGHFSEIDKHTHAMIPWLLRHLGSIEFAHYVIDRLQENRMPHRSFRQTIRRHLAEDSGLPTGFVIFWNIIAAEGNWARKSPDYIFAEDISNMFFTNPRADWAIQELACAFQPKLILSKAYHWNQLNISESDSEIDWSRLNQIAVSKVTLAGENIVSEIIYSVNEHGDSDSYWAERLCLLTRLLKDAWDLYALAGEADEDFDPAVLHRPSIRPHPQNYRDQLWTNFFDLIWKGWLHLDAVDSEASRRYIQCWSRINYPAFRRLALEAIRTSQNYTPEEKLKALTDD